MIGNTTEEASDILSAFNFIPQDFGVYKLVRHKNTLYKYLKELDDCQLDYKKMARVNKKYEKYDFGPRAVIDYMPNTEAYKLRRKGTIGDILAGNTSNFTNSIETDISCVKTQRLTKPEYIIKFSKDPADWFTVWEGNIVAKYNKEIKPGIAMKRYADEVFNPEVRDNIFAMNDSKCLYFHNLITQKQFRYQLSLIKRQ